MQSGSHETFQIYTDLEEDILSSIKEEINRRRTFAIISHPDAGKTTLTEKFLLYGGAINLAGSVKGKATARHAVSDWMEIEKQRGISVTSSVLQFEYDGFCINLLDTPGHQDFSEDTYRTLMAADSAVMVIDASKGVEPQTRKLFKVCVMRKIPIFTFINKMDRDANDTFELLDEIEKELGIATCPINWPIGSGKSFKGVYDRNKKCVITYSDTEKGTKEGEATEIPLDELDKLTGFVGEDLKDKLIGEIELLDGASCDFDLDRVRGNTDNAGFLDIGNASSADKKPVRVNAVGCAGQKRTIVLPFRHLQKAGVVGLHDADLIYLIGDCTIQNFKIEGIAQFHSIQMGKQYRRR